MLFVGAYVQFCKQTRVVWLLTARHEKPALQSMPLVQGAR